MKLLRVAIEAAGKGGKGLRSRQPRNGGSSTLRDYWDG